MTCQGGCASSSPGEFGEVVGQLDGLVGDFDALSSTESDAWLYRLWQRVAEVCGFEQALHDAALSARRSRVRLGGLHAAALAAFAAWTRARGFARPRRAQAQMAMMQVMAGQGRAAGSVWRVEADASGLPGGACVDGEPGPDGMRACAFLADGAPGYFADALAGPAPLQRSACGWRYPVALNFGTFPWVYGSRLDAQPPALAWDAEGDALPAAYAMQLAASLWRPLGNLQEDSERVRRQYEHFRKHTQPMFLVVPSWEDARRRPAGVLFQRAGLLHVEHGSLESHRLIGPRGVVAASAYNAIKLRFAAFFVARRAFVRAAPFLPEDVRAALARHPNGQPGESASA